MIPRMSGLVDHAASQSDSAEALTMIAVQVMANDVASASAVQRLSRDERLKPLMIHNITHSITIMTDGCTNFRSS